MVRITYCPHTSSLTQSHTYTHILQAHQPTHLQHPPAPPPPAVQHPLVLHFLPFRANLPAANALVLAIYRAALWINVLLPWHQLLVALGSPCGWLARDYYAFHEPAITEKAYISKPTKYIMAYNNA